MMYIAESGELKGKQFTERQMYEVYRDIADRKAYPAYHKWLTAMLNSGVFRCGYTAL